MHAFVGRSCSPAISLRAFSVPIEIHLSVVDRGIVFAGYVESLPTRSEYLVERGEPAGLGGMCEGRRCGSESLELREQHRSASGAAWSVAAVTSVFVGLLKPMWKRYR